MGALSTRPALFLAWPSDPGAANPPRRELSIEELVEQWVSERKALERRATLQVVRSDEFDPAAAA